MGPVIVEATRFRGRRLLANPVDAIEDIVLDVCQRLAIDYAPPKPVVLRMPLGHRLADELKNRKSSSHYDVADFHALLKKCDLVVELMTSRDYPKAKKVLGSILVDLEVSYDFPNSYYPRIAEGAILLAEANSGRNSHADVERHFSRLIAERSEYLDANAYAGLADALINLGRFGEAISALNEAERHLEGPDPALFYNSVRARVIGKLTIDREDADRRRSALGQGIITQIPGDLSRLTSVLSLSYAYMEDSAAAIGLWATIADEKDVLPEVVLDICHCLHDQASEHGKQSLLRSAQILLGSYIAANDERSEEEIFPLRHLRARLWFDSGDRQSATREIDALIARFPASPIVRVDAAMFAIADDDLERARQRCAAVVKLRDQSECFPALSFQDFNFALGQAFWLLGCSNEAKECFRRSERGPHLSYEASMPEEFGRLAHLQ